MDFFEKLGEMAKTVSEKAEDGLELNRLGGEISIEKGNIQCYKQELGEYFWAKFVLGEVEDPEATLICDKVVNSQDNIKRLEKQMEQVKINRELAKAEDRKSLDTDVAVEEPATPQTKLVCEKCGKTLSAEQKFCSYCGKAVQSQ